MYMAENKGPMIVITTFVFDGEIKSQWNAHLFN